MCHIYGDNQHLKNGSKGDVIAVAMVTMTFQYGGYSRFKPLSFKVVAKGDAREVGDRELELFQISQSTSLPGLSVNFFRW